MKRKTIVIMMALIMSTYTFAGCSLFNGINEQNEQHEHEYQNWTDKIPSTCTSEGIQVGTCKCGKQQERKISKVNHVAGEWKTTIDPTCAVNGEQESTCTVCGQILVQVIHTVDHDYGEWSVVKQPTCTQEGERSRICIYGDVETEVIPSLGGHIIENGSCVTCGMFQYRVSEDGNEYLFGSYPQSIVKDISLIETLNSISENNDWDKEVYAYYDTTSKRTAWKKSGLKTMQLNYENENYYGIIWDSALGAKNSEAYQVDTAYWFKYEPLKWRVFGNGTSVSGKRRVRLMCKSIISAQAFQSISFLAGNNEYCSSYQDRIYVYANSYEASDIRSWLNSKFYSQAFNELQTPYIATTRIFNTAETTGHETNKYASVLELHDKVYLLSYLDASHLSEEERRLYPTDYATYRGAKASYWLRSPMLISDNIFLSSASSCYVRSVLPDGSISSESWNSINPNVTSRDMGVVPIIEVELAN